MSLNPSDITIAITVYDRSVFIEQAIESALNQTVPVRVLVVEDCGPDLTLETLVKSRYGPRIIYVRNSKRRGLFDNWNACLELCKTPWLSILHDDDYFKPTFVETMLNLQQAAPGRGLYFGNQEVVNKQNKVVPFGQPVIKEPWQKIDLLSLADANTLGFAGHLFSVDCVKRAGEFRAASLYCGDWEMWFKLAAQFGGARTGKEVAVVRFYEDWRKGTSRVIRTGQNYAATLVQRKRNYGLLKQAGIISTFSIKEIRRRMPLTIKPLIFYGANFSNRMLAYNLGLLQSSEALNPPQKLFRVVVRILGPRFVIFLSKLWRWMARSR